MMSVLPLIERRLSVCLFVSVLGLDLIATTTTVLMEVYLKVLIPVTEVQVKASTVKESFKFNLPLISSLLSLSLAFSLSLSIYLSISFCLYLSLLLSLTISLSCSVSLSLSLAQSLYPNTYVFVLTSASIRAWRCNFPFSGNYDRLTIRPTNRPTDGQTGS